jgi:hypothetical protein
MAAFNYTTPFKAGQTVTVTRTGFHGLVVNTYVYQGETRVNVRTSPLVPALSYAVHELTAYSVQACDHVVVRDDDGLFWTFEVLDVNASGTAVLFNRDEGVYDWCPMANIISVIPMENIKHTAMGGR